MKRTHFLVLACLTLFFFVFALSHGDQAELSFAEAVRNAPTRMISLPQDTATRRLLERFKPEIHVAPNSFLPIGFYEDYLPRTVLKRNGGDVVEKNASPDVLARYHMNRNYYLDYRLSPEQALDLKLSNVTPTLYGRIYADTLTVGEREIPLLFLKYSPAFPYSGLPYGNSWGKNMGGWLAGDPWGWHELDIHGAVHVILHAGNRQPIGVLLAQHNNHRTLLTGPDFSWPDSNRVRVSYSVRSNEPYLITETMGSRLERTVGNPSDIPTLFGRSRVRPLSAGHDKIVAPNDGARKIETRLRLLPHDDPLYTSVMDLGDRLALFGFWDTWYRQGPPGMDYYTHPALKNLADLAAFWNIDPDDDRFFSTLEKNAENWRQASFDTALIHQKKRFMKAIDPRYQGTESKRNPGN